MEVELGADVVGMGVGSGGGDAKDFGGFFDGVAACDGFEEPYFAGAKVVRASHKVCV